MARPPKMTSGPGAPPGVQNRVLIVDDDFTTLVLLEAALTQAGYRTLCVATGGEALAQFAQFAPDIVLLDIMLPDIDGYRVCSQMRLAPEGEAVPIVMITGLGDINSITRAFDSGATDFFSKPINPELVPFRVKYILRATHLMMENRRNQDQLRLAARVFEDCQEGILITDTRGVIEQANPAFSRITGFEVAEVVGKTPGILKSRHHSAGFYEELWNRLRTEGKWAGEIWDRRKNGDIFPEWLSISEIVNDQGAPTNYVGVFHDVTLRRDLEVQIRHNAYYDVLTDLPNRQLFHDRLKMAVSNAKRSQTRIALMFLDLDGFKSVNDTLGHEAGDTLLKLAAQRLSSQVREGDSVFRLGGDEFTILLPSIQDPLDAALVAQRAVEEIALPFDVGGQAVHVSVSVGICVYPDDAASPEELVNTADQTMYEVKRRGKADYMFHSARMEEELRGRLSLRDRLAAGIGREEFILLYQPRFDCRTGALSGFEALLRWRQHDGALLLPAEFLSLAIGHGLMMGLGARVLGMACAQAARWAALGHPQLTVSVNLSGWELAHRDLMDSVVECLRASGLPPGVLELEVPEKILSEEVELARKIFTELKRHGVRVVLDNYGLGASSLADLKGVPLDMLKIDGSFFDGGARGSGLAIASSIINLSHSLGIKTVAMQVEKVEELAGLADLGCDYVQGFLLGGPMTGEEAQRLVSNGGVPSAHFKAAGPTPDRCPLTARS